MRLDKYLVSTGKISRSEAGKAARGGRITVNGSVEKRADRAVDPLTDCVILDGEPILYRQYTYILLNKPAGYVSATEDGRDPTVLELLPPELRRIGLFPCGRLDKYTLGLMLLTNDGATGHRLLSPRHHVEKEYHYTAESPLSEEDIFQLESGVVLDGGYRTKPSRLFPSDDNRIGTIVLTEGKYHQIKRMFEAVNNRIISLERIRFDTLTLDGLPERGTWRYLTPEEIRTLCREGSVTDS